MEQRTTNNDQLTSSMITKEHIRQYLDKLSSGIAFEQGRMPAHVWEQFHQYMVNHYKRLDKETRAYADEIFNQMEADVKRMIDSLPEGREKKGLSRKLSMVRGERSPLPVLYLDTPVIENIIRHDMGQKSSQGPGANPGALYEEVLALVKDGNLICPEDSFHREALQLGGSQAREGLNIMRRLSAGLSFKYTQAIEDSQVFRALRSFIEDNGPVHYRKFWQDAFQEEAVNAIMRKRSSIVFNSVLGLAERSAATATRKAARMSFAPRLRIRYDEASLQDQQQLQQQSARHLRDLARLGMKYQALMSEATRRHLSGFWEGQKIALPLALWNHYGGKPEGLEGLVSFYESEHFRNVPAIKIKQDIWHALSVHHGEGLRRVTGPADVNILSCLLPYTDIMILGRNMMDVVRDRLKLDLQFDTEIYSADEHDLVTAALRRDCSP